MSVAGKLNEQPSPPDGAICFGDTQLVDARSIVCTIWSTALAVAVDVDLGLELYAPPGCGLQSEARPSDARDGILVRGMPSTRNVPARRRQVDVALMPDVLSGVAQLFATPRRDPDRVVGVDLHAELAARRPGRASARYLHLRGIGAVDSRAMIGGVVKKIARRRESADFSSENLHIRQKFCSRRRPALAPWLLTASATDARPSAISSAVCVHLVIRRRGRSYDCHGLERVRTHTFLLVLIGIRIENRRCPG